MTLQLFTYGLCLAVTASTTVYLGLGSLTDTSRIDRAVIGLFTAGLGLIVTALIVTAGVVNGSGRVATWTPLAFIVAGCAVIAVSDRIDALVGVTAPRRST